MGPCATFNVILILIKLTVIIKLNRIFYTAVKTHEIHLHIICYIGHRDPVRFKDEEYKI